jgi:hypothetical protein
LLASHGLEPNSFLPTSFKANCTYQDPKPSPQVEHWILVSHKLSQSLKEKEHSLQKAIEK